MTTIPLPGVCCRKSGGFPVRVPWRLSTASSTDGIWKLREFQTCRRFCLLVFITDEDLAAEFRREKVYPSQRIFPIDPLRNHFGKRRAYDKVVGWFLLQIFSTRMFLKNKFVRWGNQALSAQKKRPRNGTFLEQGKLKCPRLRRPLSCGVSSFWVGRPKIAPFPR